MNIPSGKPFFTAIVILVCLLGAMNYAQNPPQGPLTADDFNQFTWRWIGPMTFSGRITGIAVPLGQSTKYYVLTATGGVWKSVDAGETWAKVGLEKSYFINKIEVDSKNPDIVYVAAEGKLYDNDMDCERGLFKSTDGGKTWKKLTSGLPQGVALGRTGLAIFEKDPNIVYARVDEEVNLGFQERDGVANFAAPGAAAPPNPDQPPQPVPAGGGRGGRGGMQVDPGIFKVTLTVDGREVETRRLTVTPDPLFR